MTIYIIDAQKQRFQISISNSAHAILVWILLWESTNLTTKAHLLLIYSFVPGIKRVARASRQRAAIQEST